MHKLYEMDLAGRKLSLDFGKYAGLANASVLARYGDTVVLVAVTSSAKPREGLDFFPLSVDFEEKLYAAGKIPGGFIKREGRPSERAVLTGGSSTGPSARCSPRACATMCRWWPWCCRWISSCPPRYRP